MKSAVRSPAFRRERLASWNGSVSDACGLKAGLLTDFLRRNNMRKLKRNQSFMMLSYALAALTLILISSALVKRSIASIDGSSGRTQPLIYDPPDYEDKYFDEESARLNIRNGRPHPKIALFNLDSADETTEHDSF